ncbi:urate oxidase [Syncephalis fuscata]|nr:urate oxidase [Syncephalis fuscata]
MTIKAQQYGKDRIRLVKVVRGANAWQDLHELTVRVLLEGDFEASYTHADNTLVIATDSMKNTVYALAKQSELVGQPELFAQVVARHFLDTYPHVSGANVRVHKHRWARLTVDDQLHPHSFRRDSSELRVAEAHVRRTASKSHYELSLTSGITGLLVLKTTGSAFTNFLRDQFTTLPEAEDRILSTVVDANWVYRTQQLPAAKLTGDAWKAAAANPGNRIASDIDYEGIYQAVRDITLTVFSNDQSASVQATLYRMAQQILDRAPEVNLVSYALPNKHVFTVNLEPFGQSNVGKDATIFMPFDDPAGLITATITRHAGAKL